MNSIVAIYKKVPLVAQIILGMLVGIALAYFVPTEASFVSIFGELFVKALKSVAPLLVLVLVTSAIASHRRDVKTGLRYLLVLYIISTVLAGSLAVAACFIFGVKMPLPTEFAASSAETVSSIGQVVYNFVVSAVSNPIRALADGNFISILVWAVALGVIFRKASNETKLVLKDLASVVTDLVKLVIRCAPLGVMGLCFAACTAEGGFSNMVQYGKVLVLLVGVIFFMALVINPLMVAFVTRQNPFPLVFLTLRTSALQAFFSRSSAANIPVNMEVCDRAGVSRVMSSISIPLGATINMAGAAITISVFTLTTVFSMGVPVDVWTALLLCVVSGMAACGASCVAGGSLMLIPLACSLFGLNNDIAMYVVGVGMIVGVIQDSCETALNSSTDALLTIAVHKRQERLGLTDLGHAKQ